MGMFDTVNVPCPRCSVLNPFQSKGGDCVLAEYGFRDAPQDVLADLGRHEATCRGCGARYRVNVEVRATPVLVEAKVER